MSFSITFGMIPDSVDQMLAGMLSEFQNNFTFFTLRPPWGWPIRGRALIAEVRPPPPNREKIPPLSVEDPGYISSDLRWFGGWRVRLWTDRSSVRICLVPEHLDFPPVVHDWANKVLGMSSRVCVNEHIQDPMPLIEKSRASCPSGRFAPSFIHQVIITGLNKLYDCIFSPYRWP